MGVADESFREPGAVPFKWEAKPGVPKVHIDQPRQPPAHVHSHSPPSPPQKLTPPPSRVYSTPPLSPPTQSFCSTTSLRSDRHRVEPRTSARPLLVSTTCFLLPMFRRRLAKKKVGHKASSEHEPDHACSESSDLARWFKSAKKSQSLRESSTPLSSSPQSVCEPEWIRFKTVSKLTS